MNKVKSKFSLVAVIAILFLSSLELHGLTRSDERKVAVKLDKVIKRYMMSYTKENILMAMGTFAKDPILYWSSGILFKGTDEARASLMSAYKEMEDFKSTWKQEEAKIKYDMAVVVGVWSWSALHVGTQKKVTRKVRTTFVFIREYGNWKIWHEHSSLLYIKKNKSK